VLGEGVVDVPAVLQALRDTRLPSDVMLSIEYESNPFDPYDDLARAIDFVAEAARA
jgi:sugar phosphate isomerase/epimerase